MGKEADLEQSLKIPERAEGATQYHISGIGIRNWGVCHTRSGDRDGQHPVTIEMGQRHRANFNKVFAQLTITGCSRPSGMQMAPSSHSWPDSLCVDSCSVLKLTTLGPLHQQPHQQ